MIRFTDVVPETKPKKAPERQAPAAPSETPKPKTPRKPKKPA